MKRRTFPAEDDRLDGTNKKDGSKELPPNQQKKKDPSNNNNNNNNGSSLVGFLSNTLFQQGKLMIDNQVA